MAGGTMQGELQRLISVGVFMMDKMYIGSHEMYKGPKIKAFKKGGGHCLLRLQWVV